MEQNARQTEVSFSPCGEYEFNQAREALIKVLEPLGGLSFIRKGDRVIIKANLITFLKPEKAATTHPVLLQALSSLLIERGATVVIGDSPGGPFSLPYLNQVYNATGLKDCEGEGVSLNRNMAIKSVENPDGRIMKDFCYTAYLDECDYLIDFCKLKTHGMMGMTGGAKNLFGTIPGTTKPEYHYRYPNSSDFARMLVDIDEYFKPVLTICDGVIAMEGNGPSQGKPRFMGLLAASKSPHKLDLALARIIGLQKEDVPTLVAAFERGLIPSTAEELSLSEGWEGFICPDFENVGKKRGLLFDNEAKGEVGKLWSKLVALCLRPRPEVNENECIGCGECKNVCPAQAITMIEHRPSIDRSKCIRCFCCQEFCPKGAMKVKRTAISKLLEKL